MRDELLRRRLSAQLLAGPRPRGAGTPVAVTQRLLAIQAQDPRGARLAIRARSRGAVAADVDRALTERELVITWLCRGTLHLVHAADYPLLQALTTPQLVAGSGRRLAQEGIDTRTLRRAIGVIERSLRADGPLRRGQLRERLTGASVPVAGQAFVQLLFRAAIEGLIVRGPMIDGEQRYVLVADWLDDSAAAIGRVREDRGRALAELARRYLDGHGPADARDLARWAGLSLGDARIGLGRLHRLHERADGLVSTGDPRPVAKLTGPRLLGTFEPLLMGWCSRTPVLGDHDRDVVSGGIFRSFALAPDREHPGGRPVGLWKLERSGVRLTPFHPVPAADQRALAREGDAVQRFLGRA